MMANCEKLTITGIYDLWTDITWYLYRYNTTADTSKAVSKSTIKQSFISTVIRNNCTIVYRQKLCTVRSRGKKNRPKLNRLKSIVLSCLISFHEHLERYITTPCGKATECYTLYNMWVRNHVCILHHAYNVVFREKLKRFVRTMVF